jgi:6-phospho-beta-glucosidase
VVVVLLAILGGGGFRVPLVYRALIGRPELGVDRVVLHDTDPARLAVIAAVLADAPAGPAVTVTSDLADAVRGADVIFSAIRVGGAAGRAADERRALRLGVLGQETVGAGGLAYGLRTVPVALDIAHRIADLAPSAWTINFTNPAGMITEAMRTVLGHRVIGICDSPVGLIRRACAALGVSPADVDCDYVGINHLGWLRSIRTRGGADLLPGLLADESALAGFEEGRLFGGPLLRAVGALPNEYLAFYYAHRDLAASLATGTTRGEQLAVEQADFYRAAGAGPDRAAARWAAARRHREETYLAETREAGERRDEQDLSGGGYQEVALDLMTALSGGRPARPIVNVANGSALGQLPADMVVELACTVDSAGARPLPVAPLDLHQLGLVGAVRAAERAVIDAVLQHSREQALRAFVIHPLVGSPRIAQQLLDGVLADHPALAELLPQAS